jgi:hypothetical protein
MQIGATTDREEEATYPHERSMGVYSLERGVIEGPRSALCARRWQATQGRLATIIAVPRQAVWSSGGSLKHMKGSTRRSREMKADRALSISDRQHQSARAIARG